MILGHGDERSITGLGSWDIYKHAGMSKQWDIHSKMEFFIGGRIAKLFFFFGALIQRRNIWGKMTR